MIARVGNDPCPLRLRNEWLSPCAASTLPRFGLEICASCATRGTCIRPHLLPTACREVAITSFGDHPNASITRCIAGCLRFFTLIPVIAIAADQAHAITVAFNPQPLAVILDLVKPIRAGWNLRRTVAVGQLPTP